MKIGDSCPQLTFDNHFGKPIPFSEILGSKNIVFFFYPKNFTPGCTQQACVFRDKYTEFEHFDCEVIGVSSDSEKSHLSFSDTYSLNYRSYNSLVELHWPVVRPSLRPILSE